MDESRKYPGAYLNSAELARATPHVRLSRPTPPDNTEWFDHDNQVVKEEAKAALCFDCQQRIEPGKGVQAHRSLLVRPAAGTPSYFTSCEALIHPQCNDGHGLYLNP